MANNFRTSSRRACLPFRSSLLMCLILAGTACASPEGPVAGDAIQQERTAQDAAVQQKTAQENLVQEKLGQDKPQPGGYRKPAAAVSLVGPATVTLEPGLVEPLAITFRVLQPATLATVELTVDGDLLLTGPRQWQFKEPREVSVTLEAAAPQAGRVYLNFLISLDLADGTRQQRAISIPVVSGNGGSSVGADRASSNEPSRKTSGVRQTTPAGTPIKVMPAEERVH